MAGEAGVEEEGVRWDGGFIRLGGVVLGVVDAVGVVRGVVDVVGVGVGEGDGTGGGGGRGMDDVERGREEVRGIDELREMAEILGRDDGGVIRVGMTSTLLSIDGGTTGDCRSWISGRRAVDVSTASTTVSRSISFSTSSDINAASDCFRMGRVASGSGEFDDGEAGNRYPSAGSTIEGEPPSGSVARRRSR